MGAKFVVSCVLTAALSIGGLSAAAAAPSGARHNPRTTGSTSSTDADRPAALARFASRTTHVPRAAASGTKSLLDVAYSQIRDSSGLGPSKGTTATLFFQPHGVATLYLENESVGVLGHHGTWSYRSGKLKLTFTASDFHPHVKFALSLGAKRVTMPFQLFSTKKGTSAWSRQLPSVADQSISVFNGYMADQGSSPWHGGALRFAAAVKLAAGYANAARKTEPHHANGASTAAVDDGPQIVAVKAVGNGLQLTLSDGHEISKEFVELYGWAQPVANPTQLTGSPLSSDPRVNLNVTKNRSDVSDVESKTALFYAPYNGSRIYSAFDPLGRFYGGHFAAEGFDFKGAAKSLEKIDFGVHTLVNNGSNIKSWQDRKDFENLIDLIKYLGADSGKAPGLVVINTHGDDGGDLSTGIQVGLTSDSDAARQQAWDDDMAKLAAAGFKSLLTFDGGTEDNPKTLSRMLIARDIKPNNVDLFISLTPEFWKWLESKGVSFAHSVVYIAACLTDSTPALRTAIHAGGYFAWQPEVDPKLAGGVMKYLVDEMVRPTHSAEEAYYNLVRVANTKQAVYKEDADLQGVLPDPAKFPLLGNLDAYGYQGGHEIAYDGNGFLNRKTNPGQIWYLLFASRWGQDAKLGVKDLTTCWNAWWKNGKDDGINGTCHLWDAGTVPSQDEVAYATYLLNGKPAIGYSKTLVPRLTLNDGRKD